MVAAASAWEVETPTGRELAPLGWDEEDTAVMQSSELKPLIEQGRQTSVLMKAVCSVTKREGSRPALRLDIVER